MTSINHLENDLWQETPLIYSQPLSSRLNASVYLKLENLHPSYSFKFRGISHFVKVASEKIGPSVHLVIASGGNAGLAAACAAKILGLKCSVFIPDGAAQTTINILKQEGANVIIGGRFYLEAVSAAQALVKSEKDAVMVPAYEHPLIWEGHGSMVTEIHKQLGRDPDAIFCSVGGGGLLGGLIEGCKKVGWETVPLIALETIGSDCFYHSMSLNKGRFNSSEKKLPLGVNLVHNKEHDVYLAHFTGFTSRASGSLGASEPAAGVVRMALERPGGVKCVSVPDELSMEALASFTDDHKLLVELACATTLVPAYHPSLFERLVPVKDGSSEKRTIVFIVCGGFKIDLETASEYKRLLNEAPKGSDAWSVRYDDGQCLQL
ncbi:hypothetical protein CVT24_010420 [Panaeolus cyanescens]|uniref:L-serine ammonia-lyase n=1 Tax=Panaeolus cyanescens TaxID=181874 RepID=A0A409YPN3_9AGAR|nr:hypothetical protein CVT24_010420 [Panaeolus cyanescens]